MADPASRGPQSAVDSAADSTAGSGAAPAGGATADRLLGGRVVLAQPRQGYRAAIDPVLLAAATPAAAGERVLDLGCGAGAASLCLAARVPAVVVIGLELQPELASLAEQNAAANGLADRVRIVRGDLLCASAALKASAAIAWASSPEGSNAR